MGGGGSHEQVRNTAARKSVARGRKRVCGKLQCRQCMVGEMASWGFCLQVPHRNFMQGKAKDHCLKTTNRNNTHIGRNGRKGGGESGSARAVLPCSMSETNHNAWEMAVMGRMDTGHCLTPARRASHPSLLFPCVCGGVGNGGQSQNAWPRHSMSHYNHEENVLSTTVSLPVGRHKCLRACQGMVGIGEGENRERVGRKEERYGKGVWW